MAADAAGPLLGRRGAVVLIVAVLVWAACGFWNFVKPMPAGTRVATLPARLAESQVDFIDDLAQPGATLRRELAAVDRADQMVVLDQCPLAPELARHLLARKHQRPNLKIVLVTDPRNEAYGGTAVQMLNDFEASGIIVARIRLERLRDSNPLYSSLWRLALGWWSDPFDEVSGQTSLIAALRQQNSKSDQRQLLVADDGAGGWSSIVASSPPSLSRGPTDSAALEIRGPLAREIVASELQIAGWSSDDDRLPAAPPMMSRGLGAIDARFLTEGALQASLRDAIGASGSGDSISIGVREFGDRLLVHALKRAAARGVRLQLVLDPDIPANRAAAAELVRDVAGNLDVRWLDPSTRAGIRLILIRHRSDVWLDIGSADFVRRDLDDLNLEAGIELHMPAHAAPARAAADYFARLWSGAAVYALHADESTDIYWRYRVAEATGLEMF
jgi:PLD-like domain